MVPKQRWHRRNLEDNRCTQFVLLKTYNTLRHRLYNSLTPHLNTFQEDMVQVNCRRLSKRIQVDIACIFRTPEMRCKNLDHKECKH